MRRLMPVLLCAVLVAPSSAQESTLRSELEAALGFESSESGSSPHGWGGGPPGTIFVDDTIVHAGRSSARLERTATSAQMFTTITKSIPADFAGKTIEWRGFLRSENVSDFFGLWMREDGDTPGLAFASMQPRALKGTTDWTEYSISLPIEREATQLYFGVLLGGTGKVWADDLKLLVDGKPLWDAPKTDRPKTPLELDHQFDAGSGIVISALTPAQIENLATLGKAWGFLKYHHPALTAGAHHWDYDLFRIMPKVLAARDRNAAHAVMAEWVRGLGPVTPCVSCATLREDNLHLRPELGWLANTALLGRELSDALTSVNRSRSSGKQFYVSQAQVGNPQFDRERGYAGIVFPDAGYQLLSLYRFWNIVEYWYPNRNILDENWDRVLAEFIPRIGLAKNKTSYQLETIALIAKVTDTHANLWSAPPQIRPPAGDCQLPVTTRFVEDRAVVTGYADATTGPATGLNVGDAIDSIDDVPVATLVSRWTPYYPASNQPTRLRDIGRSMMRGACADARLAIDRGGRTMEIAARRQPLASVNQQAGTTHDRPGDTFQLLSDQVAYVKLSSVRADQASTYISRSQGTKGLVIDIRNYPSEFVVFAIGNLLAGRATPFAQFTTLDLQHPGAFRWAGIPSLEPQQPHYAGKVVVLVDEVSQSQAEYTTMAFRAAGAIVVGSTTAGADGNVSQIPLPGGLRTMISGLGVFYPDKTPTQRIGIVPDVVVRPTITGIRAGRDEVLEEALRQILGRETPADRIRQMARPRP
jgi:peptidase S41-like protein